MNKNIGTADRVVRVILALIVGFLLLNGTLSGVLGIVLGVLAVVFLLTSLLSFCPLYALLGWNSGAEDAVVPVKK
jgi:hypothetical protein